MRLRILSPIALIGLLASMLLHAATFFNQNWLERWPQGWALHLLAILVFTLFVLHSRSLTTPYKQYWGRLRQDLPAHCMTLILLAFAYLLFNFGLFLYQYLQGSIEQIGNSYWLVRDGKRLALSLEQIAQLKLQEARLFSGHWLFFFLLPYLYFRYLRSGR